MDTKNELFKTVYIKTEADLPGKEGLYPCYADGKGLCWFGVPQNHKYEWMSKVKWYIKPIEKQESKRLTDAEITAKAKLYAGDFFSNKDLRDYCAGAVMAREFYTGVIQDLGEEQESEWLKSETEKHNK